MASSRKPRSADAGRAVEAAADAFLAGLPLRRKRVAVGLSGGLDSVVLLQVLHALRHKHGYRLSALHVHHGLSENADAWTRFCTRLCRTLKIPLAVRRVRVTKTAEGWEAAARKARYAAYRGARADAIALGHHQDDQAETVLFNLLRGTGRRGLAGMAARSRLDGKVLLRPFLDLPRAALAAYAIGRQLQWVEDESNADESLTRNFLRRRLGPLIASRFPRWQASVARAARHAAQTDLQAGDLLRAFLREQGLRAPSEAKLGEMLRQLGSGAAATAIAHDGKVLRTYRGRVLVDGAVAPAGFREIPWNGEPRVELPALGGAILFRRTAGVGLDAALLKSRSFTVRLRAGGERLQPDPKRPRRTLKNLFQEAGIPPHERERLPLLFCGADLAWVPGLGIDARFQARGASARAPQWKPKVLFLRKSKSPRDRIAR
jgi:tRNA(Ile)-lysidine synthase